MVRNIQNCLGIWSHVQSGDVRVLHTDSVVLVYVGDSGEYFSFATEQDYQNFRAAIVADEHLHATRSEAMACVACDGLNVPKGERMYKVVDIDGPL